MKHREKHREKHFIESARAEKQRGESEQHKQSRYWGQSQLLLLPSLILRILKSLANISSSRICGESMVGASSGSRTLFRWASAFTSPMLGPPGASSVERKAEGSEEKPWLNAQEPLLKPWSGNLYKQGVRDPAERERERGQRKKISWSVSQGSQTVRGVPRAKRRHYSHTAHREPLF